MYSLPNAATLIADKTEHNDHTGGHQMNVRLLEPFVLVILVSASLWASCYLVTTTIVDINWLNGC